MKVAVVTNTMGQGIIRTALANLGGKATLDQVRAELRRLDASASLDKLATDRLNKMHKRYEVDKVQQGGVWYYVLVQS